MVKREVVGMKRQGELSGDQVVMLAPCPFLSARGLKPLDVKANRFAGPAVIAMGAVGKRAAAPEALFNQPAVDGGVDQMIRCGNLRPCHLTRQVTAWVSGRRVKLQAAGIGVVGVAHGAWDQRQCAVIMRT